MQLLFRRRQRETDRRLSNQLYERVHARTEQQKQALEKVGIMREFDAITTGRRR